MIRLLLADDHGLVRDGLRAAFSPIEDIELVATVGDGIAALRDIKALRPEVAIIDLHLPGRTGVEVARRVRDEELPTRVLVMTSFDDEASSRAALQAGATGFMGKGAPIERLVEGVRSLARGESYVLGGVGSLAHSPAPPEVRDNPLSPREREVLRLIATGLSTPEIASQLGTSRGTVKNQTASILAKLGVGDRTRAALVGLRDGWI